MMIDFSKFRRKDLTVHCPPLQVEDGQGKVTSLPT
jgi:hypothetical protein